MHLLFYDVFMVRFGFVQYREKCCWKVLMFRWNWTNKINRNPIMKMNSMKMMVIIRKLFHQHPNYKEQFHGLTRIRRLARAMALIHQTPITLIPFIDRSLKVGFTFPHSQRESFLMEQAFFSNATAMNETVEERKKWKVKKIIYLHKNVVFVCALLLKPRWLSKFEH